MLHSRRILSLGSNSGCCSEEPCTLDASQILDGCSLLSAGLLLASIRDPDPVVFFEAKMLYRTVTEEVPSGEYTIPLGDARIARAGSDITLVGWGQQVAVLERAVSLYSRAGGCLCLHPLQMR